MPTTIKDIICDFKNKFGLSGLWSKPTSYMEYEDVTNKVESYLESSLTSLLDSIKADIEKTKEDVKKQTGSYKYDDQYDDCINIINSHR